MERTFAPVVNSPAAVLATGRAANSRRLGEIPGVIAPMIANLPRVGLASALVRRGFRFPLLLRAPGYHNGRHFVRVENADGIDAALAELPGDELTAIQYLDARGADGKHRKYRVMMIGGWLYPLHLAISTNWKIHYVTADMADDAGHRAEESKFLQHMPEVLGPRAMAALADIQETLGLDYGGIDFGLSQTGDVLLFEANATMTVLAPGKDKRWDYRRAAIQRVEDAVRANVGRQSAAGSDALSCDILAAKCSTDSFRLQLSAPRLRNNRRQSQPPLRFGPANEPAPVHRCFSARSGKLPQVAASTA